MNLGRFRVAFLAAWFLCFWGCNSGEGPGAGDGTGRFAATATVPVEVPSQTADTGAGFFRGRVLFDGPVPGRQKLLVVKDVAVCGRVNHLDDRLVVGEEGGIRNAVVSVRGVKGGRPLLSMGDKFTLDQRACAYSPHVLILPAGSPLTVSNNDGVLHNIHTFSTLNKPFNVAQPKVLKEIERTFDVPEKIAVRCDVHGWMCAWVVVVDDPYHAVTDEEGMFEISGIPPGEYVVECWQEELGEQSSGITLGVTPGGARNASHDFVYSNVPRQGN